MPKNPELPPRLVELLESMKTPDDQLDTWLRDTAGQEPGGEYIAYPVETADRPGEPVSDPREREVREEALRRSVRIVRETTPEQMAEHTARVTEDMKSWLQELRREAGPDPDSGNGHASGRSGANGRS